MPDLLVISLLTLTAGLAIPMGALLGEKFNKTINPSWNHMIIAFGGGTLLAAVSLVLVPEGISNLTIIQSCFWIVLGAIAFLYIDVYLAKINTRASQLVAMLADFIPQSLALGSIFLIHKESAILLTLLITFQNLPEGFNAFIEVQETTKINAKRVITVFFIFALFGPLCAFIGYYWLSEVPEVIGAIMLFASGGILYSIFQDIAPKIPLKNSWSPPLGAIIGFVTGLIGFMSIN